MNKGSIEELKEEITGTVKSTPPQRISGDIMQTVLVDVVDTLSDGKNLQDNSIPDDKLANPVSIDEDSRGYVNINVGNKTKKVLGKARENELKDELQEQIQEAVSQIQPIVIEGDVTNAADEEDITSSNSLLKIKNRNNVYSEYAYVILRKNKSFAEQVTDSNTIYEIRYDFDLDDEAVTIPSDCVLKFEGGVIRNGSVVFDNTLVKAEAKAFEHVSFSGTLCNTEIIVDVFGATPDNSDNSEILNNLFSLATFGKTYKFIFKGRVSYNITEPLELWFGYENRCHIIGNEATIRQQSDNIPILICHEWCVVDNLKLIYNNEQPQANDRAIAIGYSRLVYSEIKNITIQNAHTCIGVVTDAETQHPTTDRSMVNCNIYNINTWQISGYFLNLDPLGFPGLTSGTYFNNIYFGITHYNKTEKNEAISFCKTTNNSQITIGELNIEGGFINSLFDIRPNACITIQTLHIEGIKVKGYAAIQTNGSSSIIVEDFDIDYNCEFKYQYGCLAQPGSNDFLKIGRLKINQDLIVNNSLFLIIPSTGTSVAIIDKYINTSSANVTILNTGVSGNCLLRLQNQMYPMSGNSYPTNSKYTGRSFWKSNANRMAFYNGVNWVDEKNYPIMAHRGTSSQRPQNLSEDTVGFCYFDTDLKKPIYIAKVEAVILEFSTSNYEYAAQPNPMTPGESYIVRVLSGQGSKFGYMNSNFSFRDLQDINRTGDTEIEAKDWPYLYVTSNTTVATMQIIAFDYIWVDANGEPVDDSSESS